MDPRRTRGHHVLILRDKIGGREHHLMKVTGYDDVVVRKRLVEDKQLAGESCLLIRIDKSALLAEKAVVNLRAPYQCGEEKAFCIPNAICDIILGDVGGVSGPEDPDISVMVDTATTRAQALHGRRLDRCGCLQWRSTVERDGGIHHDLVISFQREDQTCGTKTSARRGYKIKGIVHRRFEDPGRCISCKQVVLPMSLLGYVMLVAQDSITEVQLGIRRTKNKSSEQLARDGWRCDKKLEFL
ncbi:Zinc finger protein [Plakobranchus ocellatus]|uniref:Zinc finger protein n=1 Tax=Plakobranchus ocellatus TaxID=259542 RepID=A0AAV3ZEF4_9GAST|nr:Zinc finger protein [Plakobranchus ocellatus]